MECDAKGCEWKATACATMTHGNLNWAFPIAHTARVMLCSVHAIDFIQYGFSVVDLPVGRHEA